MEITGVIIASNLFFRYFLVFTETNKEACAISIIWTFVPFGVWVCRGIIAVRFLFWMKKHYYRRES